jgi:non-canonical poly(A) RNA polymerase PAPD5/7
LSTVTSTPRLDTDDEEDSEPWLRDLVLSLVSGLHTDTEDFVLVGKRKKRAEIPPKRKNARKRRTESRAREPYPPLLVKQAGRVYPVNSTLRLHSDLVDFQASVGENLETSSVVRLLLTEKIQRLARSRFPGAKAEVYGSFATQLALPSSDLDLVILHRRIQGRETAQKAVETLASTISRQGFAKNIQVFESAAVPLVRFQVECGYFNGTGDLKVDISFDSRRPGWTHSGLVAAQYMRELIAVRPGLRSLVLALKQVLTMYGLNCAYTGGLSSYALLIWTAAYIGEAHCSDFGQMLTGFLAFYGNEFDPLTTGISLSPR